jgi:cation:H+ antiporter
MGNVIGSNIANIALVLGLTILIRPINLASTRYLFSWLVMLASSVMFYGFSIDGVIDPIDGLFFISGLILFITLSIRYRNSSIKEDEIEDGTDTRMIPVYFVLGAAGLYFGSEFLVANSVIIAKSLGVSEFVIGITIVALGTSLPELVTSIIAILKGQSSISIGNLIGSNIFNVFAVLGITSLVKPLGADANLLSSDLPIMLGVTLLLGLFLFGSRRLKRAEGVLLISIYLIYVLFSVV